MEKSQLIDAPCKLCSHNRSKHTIIADPNTHESLTEYCGACYDFVGEGGCFHTFEADNLKYLELALEQKEHGA